MRSLAGTIHWIAQKGTAGYPTVLGKIVTEMFKGPDVAQKMAEPAQSRRIPPAAITR
jgi:hypothetical protein